MSNTDPAPLPAPLVWEYKVLPIFQPLSAGHLNRLGQDGWELVQVGATYPNQVVAYFKRPTRHAPTDPETP